MRPGCGWITQPLNLNFAERAKIIHELRYPLADYDNFYRKFLRAGGLSVPTAVAVLKSYLKFLCETIKSFDDFLPMSKVYRITQVPPSGPKCHPT